MQDGRRLLGPSFTHVDRAVDLDGLELTCRVGGVNEPSHRGDRVFGVAFDDRPKRLVAPPQLWCVRADERHQDPLLLARRKLGDGVVGA
jgi:hypothetical protein